MGWSNAVITAYKTVLQWAVLSMLEEFLDFAIQTILGVFVGE
jgi:uncharacterized membrane protein YgaE (UPF0421/DUF939 family)